MSEALDIPVLVVFGATASGKTSLADHLFSSSNLPCNEESLSYFRGRCEIISADSMQVYRGMDIGTAKPDQQLLDRLPHHLISICDPQEQFSCGDFVRLADQLCADIVSRGKLPVVLGGTAFYIRQFLCGLPVTPESDPLLREELRCRAENEGLPALYSELLRVDPASASRIHPHDMYRILRALEVCILSGKPRSEHAILTEFRPGFRFRVISLERPRDQLYERINKRVDQMLDLGLADEFASLLEAGYRSSDPGMQAIGYREFFLTDPPGSDLELIRYQIARNSRKYAKRQEVFMNALPGLERYPADDHSSIYSSVLDAFKDSVHTSPRLFDKECGRALRKKRKRQKISTHKRKKKLRKNRHKNK